MLTSKQQEKYIRYQNTFVYQTLLQCRSGEEKVITINGKSIKCGAHKRRDYYKIYTENTSLGPSTISGMFIIFKAFYLDDSISEYTEYDNSIFDLIGYRENTGAYFYDLACKYTADEVKQMDKEDHPFPIVQIYYDSVNYGKYKRDGIKIVIISYLDTRQPKQFLKELEKDQVELLISDIEEFPELDNRIFKYIYTKSLDFSKILDPCITYLKPTKVKRAIRS